MEQLGLQLFAQPGTILLRASTADRISHPRGIFLAGLPNVKGSLPQADLSRDP